MCSTGIIILAAGNSSRLGRPKQLLPFNGKTLLQHIAHEAIDSGLSPVVVVTGAGAALVTPAVKEWPITIVHNPDWEAGMASGIVTGVQTITGIDPAIEGIIILVCDQPFISSSLLLQLTQERTASQKNIVAAAYAGTHGTPVLFGQAYFKDLLSLTGKEGAKKLLDIYKDDLSGVPFPQGAVDIDTADDYEQLING